MPKEQSSNHRIAVVEDDPIVREHFIEIVSKAPSLDLVGVAANLTDAAALIDKQPDLFLIDIGLPDGSGLDFLPVINNGCAAKALVVTSFGDRETVVSAVMGGADGYLLKDSTAETILDGIEVTLAGGAPISSAAATYLLDRLRSAPTIEVAVPENNGLTPREIEVLELFAKGASYKEAARTLEISPLTIGNHVKSIYRKLAVHSRSEAVYEAVKTGQLKL